MQYHAIPCNTMQFHAIPCNTMQYHAIQCNTLQYHKIPCIIKTADGAYHCPVGSIMAIFIIVLHLTRLVDNLYNSYYERALEDTSNWKLYFMGDQATFCICIYFQLLLGSLFKPVYVWKWVWMWKEMTKRQNMGSSFQLPPKYHLDLIMAEFCK